MAQSKSEMQTAVAKQLVDDNALIFYKESFYNYKEGIWGEIRDEFSALALLQNQYINLFATVPSTADLTAIKVKLGIETALSMMANKELLPRGLPLKSGIFNMTKKTLTEYKPEYYQFKKLPCDYTELNAKDNYPHKFLDFLCSSLEVDKKNPTPEDIKTIQFIQEWMGYSLTAYNIYEKCLIMVGNGRNGKGVLMKVWAKMLGGKNVSYCDISKIHDSQSVVVTKNKMVNFSADMSKSAKLDREEIKTAISCEMMEANEKYKRQYEFKFSAKLIILANSLPYLTEFGASISERFQLLQFRKTFKGAELNPNLLNEITPELPSIFAWACNGLGRLLERGAFAEPKRVLDATSGYMQDQDIVHSYISDYGLACAGAISKKMDVYAKYRMYCVDMGYKALAAGKFHERMDLLGYSEIRHNGSRCYQGILEYKSPDYFNFNNEQNEHPNPDEVGANIPF